jgi:hypothetical protein
MACVWLVGILFWAIPVSFITSIANLNSMLSTIGVDEVDPDAVWYGLVRYIVLRDKTGVAAVVDQ